MSDNLSFFALEPRIMFDGAMAGDVADHTSDTPDQVDQTPHSTQSEPKQVVLISDAIDDSADLAKAVKDNVVAITYDADGSLDSILDSLKAALGDTQADSIALASHKGPFEGSFYLNDTLVTLVSLTTDAEVQNFFKELGCLIKEDGRLDVLACDFGATEEGQLAHRLLTDLVGREVTASDDETGNAQSGGDWLMELGDVDASSYFDQDRLQDFDGTLVSSTLEEIQVGDPASVSLQIHALTPFGSKYLLLATLDSGDVLIFTDGTSAGTEVIQPAGFRTHSNFGFQDFVVTGGKAFFYAADATHGSELWVTDGTLSGTKMVKDICEGGNSSYVKLIGAHDGKLYFSALETNNGDRHLWTSDGTAAGTIKTSTIVDKEAELVDVGSFKVFGEGRNLHVFTNSGLETITLPSGSIYSMVELNNKVYFLAGSTGSSGDLWVTDGTESGTKLVKDLDENGLKRNAKALYVVGDKIIFAAKGDFGYNHVWASDGTEAGTQVIKGINPNGSMIYFRGKVLGDYLYFDADNGQGYGIWRTDGTTAGTTLVKQYGNRDGYQFAISSGIVFEGKLYFSANSQTNGWEMHVTDGTEAGTKMLADFNPGEEGILANKFFVLNDNLYMDAVVNGVDSKLYKINVVDNAAPEIVITEKPVYNVITDLNEPNILPIAPNGTLSDANGDAEWNGGTLELTLSGTSQNEAIGIPPQHPVFSMTNTGEFFYNNTEIGSINTSDGGARAGNPLTIIFNGNATNAIVQEVLRAMVFVANDINPAPGERTVTITATDKDGGTQTFERSILMNWSPEITHGTDAIVYSVGEAPVNVVNSLVINEDALDGAVLKMNISANSEATDSLKFGDANGLAGVYSVVGTTVYRNTVEIGTVNVTGAVASNAGQLVFTFNDQATAADVKGIWQGVAFSSSATAPSTSDRTISVSLTDQHGAETVKEQTVKINLEPVLTLDAGNVTYSAGEGPVAIASNVTVGEDAIDGAQLKIELTQNAQTTDFLEFGVDGEAGTYTVNGTVLSRGSTVIGSVNVTDAKVTGSAALVFTFNDEASAADIKAVWEGVNFGSSATVPNLADRTITVSVIDGYGADSSKVKTTIINLPPEVEHVNATEGTYVAGETPLLLDETITLSDVNGWNSASLKFQIGETGSPADFLVLNEDQTTGLRVDGTDLLHGSVIIGTLSSLEGKSNDEGVLTITFNEDATDAMVQATFRSIGFATEGASAPKGERTVDLTLTDNGGIVRELQYTLNVEHPPVNGGDDDDGGSGGIGGGWFKAKPRSILQDPVNETDTSEKPQTFVGADNDNPLGSDGTRTFSDNGGLNQLGSDGARTIIRNTDGDGARQSLGSGWGAFAFGSTRSTDTGPANGGVSDAGFGPDAGSQPGADGGDLLEGTLPPASGATEVGAQQVRLDGPFLTRDSFTEQLAKRGRDGGFGTAALLTAANEQLLKVKGA